MTAQGCLAEKYMLTWYDKAQGFIPENHMLILYA